MRSRWKFHIPSLTAGRPLPLILAWLQTSGCCVYQEGRQRLSYSYWIWNIKVRRQLKKNLKVFWNFSWEFWENPNSQTDLPLMLPAEGESVNVHHEGRRHICQRRKKSPSIHIPFCEQLHFQFIQGSLIPTDLFFPCYKNIRGVCARVWTCTQVQPTYMFLDLGIQKRILVACHSESTSTRL